MEGYADAEHGATVVVVEVDAFGHFATRDAEEDGAAAVAAGCAVGFEREGGFLTVGRFDEDQFVVPDFVKDTLFESVVESWHGCVGGVFYHPLPHADDAFHIQIAREENHNSIWCDLGELHQQIAIVPNICGIIPGLKS